MNEEIKYILTHEVRNDYLFVSVEGEKDSVDVSKRFFREISKIAEETNKTSILIVEDFPNQLLPKEFVEISKYIVGLFPASAKIAHVDKQEEDLDLNYFGESVSRVIGLSVKSFKSVEEAENWFRAG